MKSYKQRKQEMCEQLAREIYEKRQEGYSWAQLGKMLDVHRQSVRFFLNKYGPEPHSVSETTSDSIPETAESEVLKGG